MLMDAPMVFGFGLLIGLLAGAVIARREVKPQRTWQHDVGQKFADEAGRCAAMAMMIGDFGVYETYSTIKITRMARVDTVRVTMQSGEGEA